MKVGDYVRTKEFGINRVEWFDKGEPILENGFTALQNSGYKSSPNIIDLIEEDDFINQMRVSEIIKKTKDSIRFMADSDYEFSTELKEKEIESIITKEQFESMEYKL